MKVKYVIHDYAGLKGVDRTFEVSGEIAQLIYDQYTDNPERLGITILEVTDEDQNHEN